MHAIAVVQEFPGVAFLTIFAFSMLKSDPTDPPIDWVLICSVVPYTLLWAILNYRAAHHRKIRKLSNSEHGTDNSSRFQMFIRELILIDTKMAPVSSPIISGIWSALCYIVFVILHPRPSLLCPGFIEVMIMFIQLSIIGGCCEHFQKAENLVYNGRRCKVVRWNLYQSLIQDDEKNMFFYPTASLHGLIPLEN